MYKYAFFLYNPLKIIMAIEHFNLSFHFLVKGVLP
jgi:hypothetical protein